MNQVMTIMYRTTGRRLPDDFEVDSKAISTGLREPTIPEMASNLSEAIQAWSDAGFPVRPYEERLKVIAACDHCPKGLWDPKARLGLGKCKHPDCGCTRMKRFLATSHCPLGEF